MSEHTRGTCDALYRGLADAIDTLDDAAAEAARRELTHALMRVGRMVRTHVDHVAAELVDELEDRRQ